MSRLLSIRLAPLALAAVCCGTALGARAAPLRIVATIPDLGSLSREVGGDEVSVTVLAKGPQDPHFVEARPSFIRALHDADLFVQAGMDLEIGWAPALLRSARNRKVLPGGRGHLDTSATVRPLEVPSTPLDRSMGDVHPYGNPHYLTDPLNGLHVARLLRDRLGELRPEAAPGFDARYRAFARRLAEALVGVELATRHGAEEIARVVEEGSLEAFLDARGESGLLGGWLAAARARPGVKAVQEHRLWPYFAARFGLVIVETLEPRPGIAPTTRHLTEVVEVMRAKEVGLILSSPYFDPRHARWVAERTGARIAPMAHQVGARERTDDYLAAVGYNVSQALGAR